MSDFNEAKLASLVCRRGVLQLFSTALAFLPLPIMDEEVVQRMLRGFYAVRLWWISVTRHYVTGYAILYGLLNDSINNILFFLLWRFSILRQCLDLEDVVSISIHMTIFVEARCLG